MSMEQPKQELVASFQKNSAEMIKVHLQRWRGGHYADIRVWSGLKPGDPAGEQPTRKGITLSVDLLGELRAAIDKTISAVEEGQGPEEGSEP